MKWCLTWPSFFSRIQRKALGKTLYEHVNKHFKFGEIDYFALQFTDTFNIKVQIEILFVCQLTNFNLRILSNGLIQLNRLKNNVKVRWKNYSKKNHRLFSNLVGPPYTFRFRVKFYASDPQNLREELTRFVILIVVFSLSNHIICFD